MQLEGATVARGVRLRGRALLLTLQQDSATDKAATTKTLKKVNGYYKSPKQDTL